MKCLYPIPLFFLPGYNMKQCKVHKFGGRTDLTSNLFSIGLFESQSPQS